MSTVGSHQFSSVPAEMPHPEPRLEQLPALTSMPEYAAHQDLSPRLPPLPPFNPMPPRAPSWPRGGPFDNSWDVRAMRKKRTRLSIDQRFVVSFPLPVCPNAPSTYNSYCSHFPRPLKLFPTAW